MKKQDFKKWTFGLAGGFVVIAGALASCFYLTYGELDSRLAEANAKLLNAQKQVETLTAEKEELEEEAGIVAAMAEENALLKMEKIPFEVDLSDWNYVLANELNMLPQDFEVELEKTYNGQRVDRRIRKDLEAMIDAAKKEGHNLMICSSYRDYKKQDQLMDESIAKFVRRGMSYKDAFFKTKEQIALTGASEHHTGLAVDIVGKNHQSLDESQADTEEAKWLAEHAAEYGFILRYPKDKEEITMISFESWHYRYVGREAAEYMKEHNLCLEEFVELVQIQQAKEALKAEAMA
ncbi:MAG: M15 family metallopeptidase [Firmicutes bacterium]|nr:M15 family metallopeptidase [Bacillota bacterium]